MANERKTNTTNQADLQAFDSRKKAKLTKPKLFGLSLTSSFQIILLIFSQLVLISESSSASPSFLGPKIVSLKPHNGVTVQVKGSAIFECQVVSYPVSKISWRKNGKRVSEAASKSAKFKQAHGSNLSILRVNDINHPMNITCVADNSNDGVVMADAQIAEASVHVRTGGALTLFQIYLTEIRILIKKL